MISKKEFLIEFEKRFSGFCENAPIHIEYALGEISLDLRFYSQVGEEYSYVFEYDFFKSVKENIFDIHKHLQKYYPSVCKQDIEEIELSVDEIARLVDRGEDMEKAIKHRKKKILETNYLIDKLLLNQNTLVLIDKADKKSKYKMKLKKPAVIILGSFTQDPVEDWKILKSVEKGWEKIEHV